MLRLGACVALLLSVASARPANDGGVAAKTVSKRATTFWYANMDHEGDYRGITPDINDDAYAVFVEVAAGDGGAIQGAINSATNGNRSGQWLASQPRVVYIPPGEYEISSTIRMNTDTILMGDATDPPVFKAAAGFSDDQTLISGQDPTTDEKGELSFTVGLKNIILDTTNIGGGNDFVALHWGVAQGAQLQNVKILMPSSSNGNGHTGIKLTRGSTLGLSDVRIEKGQVGINHDGHQQAMYKSIYFFQNTIGMLITGGNTINIVAPTFDTCGTAVRNTGGSPFIGIVDAKSINSGVTFVTTVYPSVLIDNLSKDTDSNIAQNGDGVLLTAADYVAGSAYTFGNTVGRDPIYGATTSSASRGEILAPGGQYPVVPAPNYADNPVSDFINVKDPDQNGGQTVLGDNTGDQSDALNAVLQYAADNNKIAYFPYGNYRVESTVLIPVGSRIVGEAWSTISGAGDFFKDDTAPKPIVSVGKEGDTGVAQIQDMRFTVSDVLPGAIILQFNMAGNAPGDVALWNSLVLAGGTLGAPDLTDACRDSSNQCKGVFIGMHFTENSSVYLENVWNWVADHITESFDGGSAIAGKGGVLVESTKGTWLHALGSEHWWLYQLNLHQASNVLVTMLQAEPNYNHGADAVQLPPAPWEADVAGWGDPDFSNCGGGDGQCRVSYANHFNGGANIFSYASAAWTFYSGPGISCPDTSFECQQTMHWIETTPDNFNAYGLCSKGAHNVLRLGDGSFVVTQDGFEGSWPNSGGDIGRYTPA